MRTFHLNTTLDKKIKLSRPVTFKKIKVAVVTGETGSKETRYVEGYRVRLASRDVRRVNRAINPKRASTIKSYQAATTMTLVS